MQNNLGNGPGQVAGQAITLTALANAGFRILPIAGDGSKRPLVSGFGKAAPDFTVAPEGFGPTDMVGFMCGPCPALGDDWLAVLDLDGDTTLDEVNDHVGLDLPTTLSSKEYRHFYFRVPDTELRLALKNKVRLFGWDGAPSVDMKFAGGYAIERLDAAWWDGPFRVDAIAELPEAWIRKVLAERAGSPPAPPARPSGPAARVPLNDGWETLAATLGAVWPQEAGRHESALALGGILADSWLNEEDIARFACAVFLAAGTKNRVKEVLDSVSHKRGDPKAECKGWPILKANLKAADRGDYNAALKALKAGVPGLAAPKVRLPDLSQGGLAPDAMLVVGSDDELGGILLADMWPGAVFDEGELWAPTADGLWRRVPEGDVFAAARRFDGAEYIKPNGKPDNIKINAAKQTSIYRTLCNAVRKTGFFDDAPAGVAFVDTFVGQAGPEPLTLTHKCRVRFPFAYQAAPAAAPLFRKLLADSLTPADGNTKEGAAKARCLLEYVGRCMLGVGAKEQCAIMCIGSGNNGKSQLLEVFDGLMPAGTVSSVDPSDMSNDQHRAGLVGARLNLVYEISEKEIFKTGQFKKIISGEKFKVKVVYRPPFDARANAGHLFACNALPQTDDPSPGFWRRWAVIPFDNEVPAERRILDFAKAILAAERAQIASAVVQFGLASLAPGAAWTKPESSIKAKQDWIDESDQVRCFAADCLEPLASDRAALRGLTVVEGPGQPKTYGHWTLLQEVYDKYRKWQEGSGTGQLGRTNFTKALRARGWDTHKLNEGVRVACKLKAIWVAPGGG
jgi:hypothetical protein